MRNNPDDEANDEPIIVVNVNKKINILSNKRNAMSPTAR